MKKNFLCAIVLLTAGPLFAADSTPNDDVKSAADKLAAADSYAWKTTVEAKQFRPGPSTGQTEKDGYTYLTFSMRDNTTEAVIKGGKAIIKTDDGWQTLQEASKDNGDGQFNPIRFLAFRLRNYKNPAEEAANLAGKTKELTKSDDVYSGDMTEDGAKSLLNFRRPGGGDGPAVSNAKGTVKFWIKDGALTKYQFKLEGTVNFNGNDRDIDRTTTVEINGVGSTKVSVPEEAKKKLS